MHGSRCVVKGLYRKGRDLGFLWIRFRDIVRKLLSPQNESSAVLLFGFDKNLKARYLDFSDLFKFDLPPFPSARKFEIGTYPYSCIWTMHSSLRLLSEVGIKNIQTHNQGLLDLLIEHLIKSNYRITSSLDDDHRSCILSFSGRDTEGVFKKLRKQNIITSLREGSIRVAPHFYNTVGEIEKLIQLLD